MSLVGKDKIAMSLPTYASGITRVTHGDFNSQELKLLKLGWIMYFMMLRCGAKQLTIMGTTLDIHH